MPNEQPSICPSCETLAPEFECPEGTITIEDVAIPFQAFWVCGLDTDGKPYHGPLIELRPTDQASALATLRKLGWQGDA